MGLAKLLIGNLNARISDFPADRTSKDKHVNPFGIELMSLCTAIDLRVCNGSFPPDLGTGDFTCHTANNSSCVDFVLVNNSLAPKVNSFSVGNLKPFSDHCPITLTMSCFSRLDTAPQHNPQSGSTLHLASELKNDTSQRHGPNTTYLPQ